MQPSFHHKEQLFHELDLLGRSGVAINDALRTLSRSRAPSIRRAAERIAAALPETGSVHEAFRAAGFSPGDVAVVDAGEFSGQLARVFRELSDYYGQLARTRREIFSRSAYPLLVAHFGAVLLSIPQAIIAGWSASVFWAGVFGMLAWVYSAVILLVLAGWGLRAALNASPASAQLVSALPGLGGVLSDATGWRFAQVLGLSVTAGGPLLRGFVSAGDSSGNALLRAAANAVAVRVPSGESLSMVWGSQPGVPEALHRAIDVGEHSGRLPEELVRAADILKTRTLGWINAAAEWLPRFLYIGIVLYTGWRILEGAMGIGAAYQSVFDM